MPVPPTLIITPSPAPADVAAQRRAASAERVRPAALYAVAQLLGKLTGLSGFDRFQLASAALQFGRICQALGVADPLAEHMPFGQRWYRYQARVVRGALDGEAQAILGGERTARKRSLRLEAADGAQLLCRARYVDRIDVNQATIAELAALPGLGDRTARRIVDGRNRAPFTNLDEARVAAGLSRPKWATPAPYLTIAPAGGWTIRRHQSSAFAALVAQLRSGHYNHPALTPGTSDTAVAMLLLKLCADRIEARRLVPKYWAASPRRMGWGLAAVTRSEPQPAAAAPVRQTVNGVAVIANGDYQRLLLDRIAAATTTIRVTMFFYSVGAGAAAPGRKLLDALTLAQSRGVDVRIILADTLPDDIRNAAAINDPAIAAIGAAGLAARRYWPETVLHEKSVVIDDRHSLTGSHNWTAGSFFRYDDVSIYVDGQDLASELAARFDGRWLALDPVVGSRRCALAILDLVPRTVVETLAGEGIVHSDALPATRAALRTLATRHHTSIDVLERARQVGQLMVSLRIAETTALILVIGGLDTPAKVRTASKATLSALFADPPTLPAPHDTRTIPAAIATHIWETR